MNSSVPLLDPVEARILGCLIEKQKTTPDGYPLTLNSLRLACNQSTNRDPVVDYDEELVFDHIQKLHRKELTRSASGHGSRSAKYRHLTAERLAIDQPWKNFEGSVGKYWGMFNDAREQKFAWTGPITDPDYWKMALLAVLLLRGPQTPGELKTRTERMHAFGDLGELEQALEHMIEAGYVERLERRPGEKSERYRHLLDEGAGEPAAEVVADQPPQAVGESADLRTRVERLEEEVAELRARLERG